MKLKLVSISVLLLILSACDSKTQQSLMQNAQEKANVNTINQAPVALITLQRFTTFDSNFSNFEEFKENLNKYIVHADFTGNRGSFTLNCQTLSSPHDKKQFQKIFGDTSYTTDLIVDLNGIVAQKETLHCVVESDSVAKTEVDFQIKKDILINNTSDITKKLIAGKNFFGTVVFNESEVIETLGTNINLQADQLISNNSTITTFSKEINLKAPNDHDGLSGGIININATKAYGDLKIIMRGQDGGTVTKTPKKIEERPIINESYNGLSLNWEWMESCDDRYDRPICNSYKQVVQCPTSGKKGIKGFKGLKAYDGRSGGNSGIANITVTDGTLFNVEISLTKGMGSIAGQPGEPGLGSLGGKAGNNSGIDGQVVGLSSCQTPAEGPIGDTGDIGDPGVTGKDGFLERGVYFDIKNGLRNEY